MKINILQLLKNAKGVIVKPYKRLKYLYDISQSETIVASIGDVLLRRGKFNHQQFCIFSRIADVKAYCEKGDRSFTFQNNIDSYYYGELKGIDHQFVELIESFKKNGYDTSSLLEADSTLCIMNGTHRVAVSWFFKNSFLKIRVFPYKCARPDNIDWYYDSGMPYEILSNINHQYIEVEEQLISTGDTFCCLLGGFSIEILDRIVEELEAFVKVCKRKRCNAKRIDIGNTADSLCDYRNNPDNFELVQFVNRIDPDYGIKKGKLYSRRIEDISRIFNKRYNKEKNKIMIFTCSCYEGKLMHDKLFPNN